MTCRGKYSPDCHSLDHHVCWPLRSDVCVLASRRCFIPTMNYVDTIFRCSRLCETVMLGMLRRGELLY
jgi:hypothetical protein